MYFNRFDGVSNIVIYNSKKPSTDVRRLFAVILVFGKSGYSNGQVIFNNRTLCNIKTK